MSEGLLRSCAVALPERQPASCSSTPFPLDLFHSLGPVQALMFVLIFGFGGGVSVVFGSSAPHSSAAN